MSSKPASSRRPTNVALNSYLRDQNDSRIPQYQATNSKLPGSDLYRNPNYRGNVPSTNQGSSQYPNGGTGHLTRGSVPTLSSLGSSGPNESIATSMGTRELYQRQNLLTSDASQGGALTVDRPLLGTPCLECPMRTILGCRAEFAMTHEQAWVDHSISHFHVSGRVVNPPKTNKCCFCDKQFHEETGNLSWAARMTHIGVHHQRGARMATARPDFELTSYLWGAGVIDQERYRDLCGSQSAVTPPDSPNEAYSCPVSHLNDRSERRRNRPNGGR